MKQYLNQLNNKINELVIPSKKEELQSKKKKYSSLLILSIYHRDIVELFITNK